MDAKDALNAMSLKEACASTGKRPEQFPANKRCVCGCILSRYNPYDCCSTCQRKMRVKNLREVNSVLPRTENGRVYWGRAVSVFVERISLPQNERLREDIFAK